MTIPPHVATLLEMAASKNGFDRELSPAGDWFGFASTKAPLRVWLTVRHELDYVAALSQHSVANALTGLGSATTGPLPPGAVAARVVGGLPDLHRLVRRAFQLSRALPDEPLQAFEKQTAKMPKTTEAERLVIQRVGQEIFRNSLLEYWQGRCPVTGLAVPALLRASHIKPWADCATDAERLDVFNGLLLAPHFDAAFDRGFITVADDGVIVVSAALAEGDRRAVGLEVPATVKGLADGHRKYLVWHRERVFEEGDLG
jgi:putative restriction endonuclease